MHRFDAAYELFEGLVSRLIMIVLGLLTLYALISAAIELIVDLRLGSEFIYTSIKNRSVVIEARAIVLIAVIVIARKLILVDFKSASMDEVAAYGGIALALGILFWLLGLGSERRRGAAPPP